MKNQVLFFLLFFLQPAIILADIIYLKDGNIIKGKIVRQNLIKIEVLLQDNRNIILDKQQILRIQYISEDELKQLEQRRIQEQKKRLEELKRLEEELKAKEEEQRKLEEERKQLLEQQRLEELKRLEEEQKRREEEQRKLEEEQRKLEEQKKLEEEKQIYDYKRDQFQYSLGLGIGSFNFPLNRFNQYYNFFTDTAKKLLKNYNQNIQVQIKSLPEWNWAGNLHLGFAYLYKDIEIGYYLVGLYQKPNPKLNGFTDRNLLIQNLELQFESYSENRFNQKKYRNLLQNFYLKIYTDEYVPFIWNYMFPFFEIGYFYRKFEYQTEINAVSITTSYNSISREFQLSNVIQTNYRLKNLIHQNAISLTLPFRFLMIFSSEFFFEFQYLYPLKADLKQTSVEYNTFNSNLQNYIIISSDFSGTFNGNCISFVWQNVISSSLDSKKVIYLRLRSAEYTTKFRKNYNSVVNLVNGELVFFNDIFLLPFNILYSKNNLFLLKESSKTFEMGIKINTSL